MCSVEKLPSNHSKSQILELRNFAFFVFENTEKMQIWKIPKKTRKNGTNGQKTERAGIFPKRAGIFPKRAGISRNVREFAPNVREFAPNVREFAPNVREFSGPAEKLDFFGFFKFSG